MAASDNRQFQTVIVSDWFATPDLSLQEWHRSPRLFCHRVPARLSGNPHPIVIVTCKEDRLECLLEFGVALSILSLVEKGDELMELTHLRRQKAIEAEVAAGRAQAMIFDAFQKGVMSSHVANQLIARLRKPLGYRDPISSCWIQGSLMYATMAVNSLRRYEAAAQYALYGVDQRSDQNARQDRSRGRNRISKLAVNGDRVFDDQPYGRDCRRLTEMMIAAVLPKLLEDSSVPTSIDLSDLEVVTPTGRRVTKKPEYFGNERKQRSIGAVPGLALAAG